MGETTVPEPVREWWASSVSYLDFNTHISYELIMNPLVMDIITDTSWRNKDLNMKTSSSPCLNDIMATGNDSGHSDQWSPNSSMALGHQYRHRRWLRPWATIWSSVTTKVRSINTDSGCDRTTGPDMVLSAVRVWMSPWTQLAVQAGHLDGNVALGHQYGSRW